MPSVQSFTIACEAPNEHGTFSEGDVLRGKVTLALIKQISAESMFIKVTGDARVHWTKRVNDRTYTYSADQRYFKLKQPLIPEWAKGRWQLVEDLRTHHVQSRIIWVFRNSIYVYSVQILKCHVQTVLQ